MPEPESLVHNFPPAHEPPSYCGDLIDSLTGLVESAEKPASKYDSQEFDRRRKVWQHANGKIQTQNHVIVSCVRSLLRFELKGLTAESGVIVSLKEHIAKLDALKDEEERLWQAYQAVAP